jgi:hypothetical protein
MSNIGPGKWKGNPHNGPEAEMALIGKHCIVCGSTLLIPLVRAPIPDWKLHCNNCSTEMPIAVLLNRKKWKV